MNCGQERGSVFNSVICPILALILAIAVALSKLLCITDLNAFREPSPCADYSEEIEALARRVPGAALEDLPSHRAFYVVSIAQASKG
jgi:hypothetical protein